MWREPMDHRQARELLPGYALGALEEGEREELLAHLQSCAACYQLAQEQVEVAAMLDSDIAGADPPSDLRARIQNSVADLSQESEVGE